MGFFPARIKQTTTTGGTGDQTLAGASSGFRSFLEGFGAGTAVAVRYVMVNGGAYEIGYGLMNMTTGVLTRSTVVESSNADALVNFSGTIDVFFSELPGDRQMRTISANTTLGFADIGNVIRCAQSTDITVTLPAAASVPGGTNTLCMGYTFRNDGSNNSIVWIDPNASELLNGNSEPFPVFAGETVEVINIGASWRTLGVSTGWRKVATVIASSVASVDFVLPQYPNTQASIYRVEYRSVRPATDGAVLMVRTSSDALATVDAGASDYNRSQMVVTGTSAVSGATIVDNAIHISTDADTTSGARQVAGNLTLYPGGLGTRNPVIIGESHTDGNGASYAGPQRMSFSGTRNAATDATGLRLIMSTGNIANGRIDLFALFD